jgi:carbamoyltransferase
VRVLGISPLDKDATVACVEDGRVLFAAAEERFSRVKQHAGFPTHALAAALAHTGWSPEDIDVVAYPFLDWEDEARLMQEALTAEAAWLGETTRDSRPALAAAASRKPSGRPPVHGLASPDQRMLKGLPKTLGYRVLGVWPGLGRRSALRASAAWMDEAVAQHRRWSGELHAGLETAGIMAPLRRSEHHVSHAANAFLASGFERALVLTLDGYGSGLSGSVSLGEDGKLTRLHGLAFPHSLGSFYESITSCLGFHPDRHAGKVVGLAAYGDPEVLGPVLAERVLVENGDLKLVNALEVYFARHLARHFPMIDVAAAAQAALERAACSLAEHWLAETGADALVLSGGVVANVKMNQRLHALPAVKRTFVYPNMGDGGCGTGLAMQLSWPGGTGAPVDHVYLGPEPARADMEAALREAGLSFSEPDDLPGELARRLHDGQVVARYAGRMEYGPRALGNRSILYRATEPDVNQWLNQRLGRTEFMPFAPVTLWEHRERCYEGLAGAEHAARFMTVTFDCTPFMKENCPAAVHVDGTARPQLIERGQNPGYYDLLAAYERLSGIPCLVNTSFNMHEEPIVCTPKDAVRAFVLGHLDVLAMGPFVAEAPAR